MVKARVLAIFTLFGAVGGCATVEPAVNEPVDESKNGPGLAVLYAAFDPARSFEGDLRPSSDDELVLTAWASDRDNYAPAYSLAIAYRCVRASTAGDWHCGYSARMLRTDRGLGLYNLADQAASASEMRGRLEREGVEWLEADVDECPRGIFAMDSIRIVDWSPDIQFRLQAVEDRELIMHPAEIRVMMRGTYTTTTYQGWRLAPGVPAAVQRLLDTLEPCWTPSKSPRPWARVGTGG